MAIKSVPSSENSLLRRNYCRIATRVMRAGYLEDLKLTIRKTYFLAPLRVDALTCQPSGPGK